MHEWLKTLLWENLGTRFIQELCSTPQHIISNCPARFPMLLLWCLRFSMLHLYTMPLCDFKICVEIQSTFFVFGFCLCWRYSCSPAVDTSDPVNLSFCEPPLRPLLPALSPLRSPQHCCSHADPSRAALLLSPVPAISESSSVHFQFILLSADEPWGLFHALKLSGLHWLRFFPPWLFNCSTW